MRCRWQLGWLVNFASRFWVTSAPFKNGRENPRVRVYLGWHSKEWLLWGWFVTKMTWRCLKPWLSKRHCMCILMQWLVTFLYFAYLSIHLFIYYLLVDLSFSIVFISFVILSWGKSCTSQMVVYPAFARILHIPGGARFLSSTVCEFWDYKCNPSYLLFIKPFTHLKFDIAPESVPLQ